MIVNGQLFVKHKPKYKIKLLRMLVQKLNKDFCRCHGSFSFL